MCTDSWHCFPAVISFCQSVCFHPHTRFLLWLSHAFLFISFCHTLTLLSLEQCHNVVLWQLCGMKWSQAFRQITCMFPVYLTPAAPAVISEPWMRLGWGHFFVALKVNRSRNRFSTRAKEVSGYTAGQTHSNVLFCEERMKKCLFCCVQNGRTFPIGRKRRKIYLVDIKITLMAYN